MPSGCVRTRLHQPTTMSYRKIVTVVNEHTASTVTARYAIALAAACQAELVLYAVHDGNVPVHTEHHLEHLVAVATALAIPVTRIIEVGNISLLLPAWVKAAQADIVFYPLGPYKQYGTDQQRHIVHSLMRAVSTDLAVIRAISLAKPHPRRIMVPLGRIIKNSDRRLVFISALAKSFQSPVTLFHIEAGNGAHKLPATIARFQEQLQAQQVITLARSGAGDIGRAITVEAITRQNDLIVLGASQRGVLRRIFSGNPVVDIMLRPPCNTVLFRGAL